MPSKSPLSGLKVVEVSAQGPGPFAGSLLADFGADVVIIDRPPSSSTSSAVPRSHDTYNRNKRSIALDLKSYEGLQTACALIKTADVFIEGFRPGVAERLGIGPDDCLKQNPRPVYGRMTGWGQHGPMANEAGHDINYLALTGALGAIGAPDTPPPPLNLVADLGGGGMYLAFGILAAVLESRQSGNGQIIDCAMIDGVAHLMSMFQSFRQLGTWSLHRQDNLVDGGAPFYGTYETRDGRYVAVGAIEPQFWQALLCVLALDPADMPDQMEREKWPLMRARIAESFRQYDRDTWIARAIGTDACISPVLSIDEAWRHPQMRSRNVFVEFGGLVHPAPAPRLSRTPGGLFRPAPEPDQHRQEILNDWHVE